MNFGKKLLKPVWNSNFTILFRNKLGIKPVIFDLPEEQSYSASDLFIWRTDGEFSCQIRITDIAKKYYGLESTIRIVFYDFNGEEICVIDKTESDFCGDTLSVDINESIVSQNAIGTFSVFHLVRGAKVAIANRCYVGYGINGAGKSFVHGNMYAKKIDLENGEISSAVRDHSKETTYYIQKPFDRFDRSELFFVNPMNKTIYIEVNGNKHRLLSGIVKKVCISDEKIVCIKSDFAWPRPLIFSYLNNHFDVHHS